MLAEIGTTKVTEPEGPLFSDDIVSSLIALCQETPADSNRRNFLNVVRILAENKTIDFQDVI